MTVHCCHAEQYEAAMQDYSTILERDPANTDARFYRGTAFERLGDVDQAIAEYTQVLRHDAGHIKASYARAACQNRRGNFAEANSALPS